MRVHLLAAACLAGCSFSGGTSAPDAEPEGDAAADDAGPDASTCPAASAVGCGTPGVVRDDFSSQSVFWLPTPSKTVFDGSTLEMQTDGNNGNEFAGIVGKRWFDLTGASSTIEVLEVPDNGAVFIFNLQRTDQRALSFEIGSGMIKAQFRSTQGNGSSTPIDFDPVAHRNLRIRELNGTVFFETKASDACDWNELFSTPTPNFANGVRSVIASFSDNDVGAGISRVDNYNMDLVQEPWCSLSDLGDFSDDQWRAFIFTDQTADCTFSVNFLNGVAVFNHPANSINCVAGLNSRPMFLLDNNQGVTARIVRDSDTGATTEAYLQLLGVGVQADGDPRILISISETDICALKREGAVAMTPICVPISGATNFSIRREDPDVVYYAGTAGNLNEFARAPADMTMPLFVGVGAESFGASPTPALSSITVDDFALD